MNDVVDPDEMPSAYNLKVGERLRVIRRQKRMSLQEVEAASGQEFKASVLGAYERGERAISVPRLERLASFYSVPVRQLLPTEDTPVSDRDGARPNKLAIDLVKLNLHREPPFDMVARLLRMIQVQRQDYNGKVITVRADDARAIAAILDVPVDEVGPRLAALDLLYHPRPADQ